MLYFEYMIISKKTSVYSYNSPFETLLQATIFGIGTNFNMCM